MATQVRNQISARNQIDGRIATINSGEAMSIVTVNAGDQRIVSAITNEAVKELGLKVNDSVTALVKSTETMLVKGDAAQLKISARNKLTGQVAGIQKGNAMGCVTLNVGNFQLGAAITREAIDDLQLNNGDRVTALFKATEVMLQKA
jgi:molybdopterin-binding protein